MPLVNALFALAGAKRMVFQSIRALVLVALVRPYSECGALKTDADAEG